MNPIEFGGQKSKIKVTIDKGGYNLVNTKEIKLNTIEIKPTSVFSSNLAQMLPLMNE